MRALIVYSKGESINELEVEESACRRGRRYMDGLMLIIVVVLVIALALYTGEDIDLPF